MTEGTKKCSCCGETKPLSEFNKNKSNKDGLQYDCNSCRQAYREANKDKKKAYYESNKDKFKAYQEARTESGHKTLDRIKLRAKSKGLPFDLTLEDISGVTHCPVFGWELKRGTGVGPQPNSPSVDRIVPELGYVKGNIQVLSNKANTMKLDATPEELIMFAEWILRTYKNAGYEP